MNLSREIAENLIARGAVRISIEPPFTWTSGIKSPIYCDNRKMISYVQERELVVKGFVEMIREKGLEFDVIGGTATAAIPWAAFLAYELGVPMVYIRPEKKAHGAGKQIEGDLKAGQRVLIVEDLISTGGSSVKAAEAVREEGGCHVADVLAIVTYGFAAAYEAFAAADLKMHTLTTFADIADAAAESGAIGNDQIEEVLRFAEDPKGWA